MKIFRTLFFVISFLNLTYAQSIKVAILDFENTSGKTEYDALSKAISNMLITDLANNIHPKKVEFFERSQLNKLLDEQKLQKSKNFDTKTAVDFGKLSGVNYVFVGSVFVLDGMCNFSSKLVDVQTSKILLAKDVSGKIETWLQLKSQLAEAIAKQLNNPISLDPSYKDQITSLSTLNQYGKILTTMDEGDIEKAEQIRSLFEETNPEFNYFKDIKDDLEKLSKRITNLEEVIGLITNDSELGYAALAKNDYRNAIKYFEKFLSEKTDIDENLKLDIYIKLTELYYNLNQFSIALNYSRKATSIYTFHTKANELELLSLCKLNMISDAKVKYRFIIDSLVLINEINFRRSNKNELLEWKSVDGIYYSLHPSYDGLNNEGYGGVLKNEIKINEFLLENNIKYTDLVEIISQYEKLEAKILKSNNQELFASDQILYFYRLSLQHAEQLRKSNQLIEYKRHLEKEIHRLEEFGVKCGNDCTDPNQKMELGFSQLNPDQMKFLQELGLSNSKLEFENNFKLYYGDFVFNYLIMLIQEGNLKDANKIYTDLKSTYVKNRSLYFYGFYWDVILGLRIVNNDLASRSPLSEIEFEKKLNIKILNRLKELGIPVAKFDALKNVKIEINSGNKIIEVDDKIVSSNQMWTKNLGVIADGLGNEIKLAKNQNELYSFYHDSIPAFCFYDFDENNGLKYGKLYNYWALKLITSNPPKGWIIAGQKEISDFLKLQDILSYYQSIKSIEELLAQIKFKPEAIPFEKSGQYNGNGFCCINSQFSIWTAESISVSVDFKLRDKAIVNGGKVSDGSYLSENHQVIVVFNGVVSEVRYVESEEDEKLTLLKKEIEYQKLVEIDNEGVINFSDINCKECCFAIRLVKNK